MDTIILLEIMESWGCRSISVCNYCITILRVMLYRSLCCRSKDQKKAKHPLSSVAAPAGWHQLQLFGIFSYRPGKFPGSIQRKELWSNAGLHCCYWPQVKPLQQETREQHMLLLQKLFFILNHVDKFEIITQKKGKNLTRRSVLMMPASFHKSLRENLRADEGFKEG